MRIRILVIIRVLVTYADTHASRNLHLTVRLHFRIFKNGWLTTVPSALGQRVDRKARRGGI